MRSQRTRYIGLLFIYLEKRCAGVMYLSRRVHRENKIFGYIRIGYKICKYFFILDTRLENIDNPIVLDVNVKRRSVRDFLMRLSATSHSG